MGEKEKEIGVVVRVCALCLMVYLDHLVVCFSFSFPEQPSGHRRRGLETPAINTLTNSHNGLVQGLY